MWSKIISLHTGDFLHQSPPILGFSNFSDFVLSQQLLQLNYLQFKSTYKIGSITASLLLLTSLFYYHVVTYKQITADFTLATFSTNLPQFWGSQKPLIFILSQQLLQFNWLQFKPTYKTGSITVSCCF